MAQETAPQTQWHHNFYVELGPKFTSHLSPNLEPFRPTGGYGAYINVDSRMRTYQTSARYEIVSPNYHWALRTGLQYSFNYKRIGYKQAEANAFINGSSFLHHDTDFDSEYKRIDWNAGNRF